MTAHEKLNRAVHFLNILSPHNLWTQKTWTKPHIADRELSPGAKDAVNQIIEASIEIGIEEDEAVMKIKKEPKFI